MTLQELDQPRIIRLKVKATGDEIRTNNVGGALIGLMKGVYTLVNDPVSQDLIDELMGRKPSIPLSLGERSEMSAQSNPSRYVELCEKMMPVVVQCFDEDERNRGDGVLHVQVLSEHLRKSFPDVKDIDRRVRQLADPKEWTMPLLNQWKPGHITGKYTMNPTVADRIRKENRYPNPEKREPDEAKRILAIMENLGVKGEEEQ